MAKKIYPKFIALIRNGELKVENRESLAQYIATYKDGTKMELVVKPWRKGRSRQEEKYYHAVVVRMIAEAMDIQDQEAHEFLKSMFLKVEEKTKGGVRFERVKSTTELSDKEYREFWEQCVRWAALPTLEGGLNYNSGLELYIPYPNEVAFDY